MELQDAIHGRRTVQLFSDDPIDGAALRRAIEAANMAPCHKLTWPWRWVLPGQSARGRLYQVGLHLKTPPDGPTPELEAKIRKKMLAPAELVVAVQVLDSDPFRQQEDYAACACAIQNLMLSLHGDGIGSKWGTGKVTRDPQTYEILGVDPETERIIGFVWVGHPKVQPKTPPRRNAMDLVRKLP